MTSTPDKIRQSYDACAPQYDARLTVVETMTGMRRMRRELIAQCQGNVLAVAIGTGRDIAHFPKDCSVTGIDLSEEMLNIARQHSERLLKPVDLQVMDAEALTFPNHTFDTVVSTLATCTFPHPTDALREMARVCKPEGKILLLEHGKSDVRWIAALQNALNDRWSKSSGCNINRDPLALAQKAGLHVYKHRRRFFGILHAMEATP